MATGKDVLAIAAKEIGTKEQPANSNKVKYNTWYYGRAVSGAAYPWCMAFVQWCYAQAGAKLPCVTASCGALLTWYKKNQPECVVKDPQPGDIIIFDFPGGAATDHTGLFERMDGKNVVSIDGNTGSGNEANGGAVMRRTRDKKYVAAYIRPRSNSLSETAASSTAKDSTAKKEENEMKRYNTVAEIKKEISWAAYTVQKLINRKALNGTGEGLDLSYDMVRMLVIMDRMGLFQ